MPSFQKPSLFGRLLLLFTVVPILELTLLVWLGGRIGFWPTVGLIAATAIIGSTLAHREGLSALARFRARMAQGEVPGDELTDGILILIAGAFLLTPGVLTDVVGFLGLLPPTRKVIKQAVSKRVRQSMLGDTVSVGTWPPPPPPESDAVDVEFEDVREDA
ncbi:MAG: FxsA family protein [Bacteroidota bacterium]